MVSRKAGRLLFLGVTDDGRVLAFAAAQNSPLIAELDALGELQTSGVFRVLPALQIAVVNTKTALLTELGRIHGLDWIASQKLDKHGVANPYTAQNGGGYTLEAELGIKPNGDARPDYLGWEIKQYRVPKLALLERGQTITLMTPEPNGGIYSQNFLGFMRTYGYADPKIADRLNFGGVHRVGVPHPTTHLLLHLNGYDADADKITDVKGGLQLLDGQGTIAASWNFSEMLDHWSRKHAQTAYIPCEKRGVAGQIFYRYAGRVKLGEGTDPLLLLRALSNQIVFYDPGVKVETVSTKPTPKKRNQFRVRFKNLPPLYHSCAFTPVL